MMLFSSLLFNNTTSSSEDKKKLPRPDLRVKRRIFGKSSSIPTFALIVVAVGLALYPIYVYPLYHTDKFRKVQKETRKDIDPEKVQPGGMRVWSNPFEPKSSKEEKD